MNAIVKKIIIDTAPERAFAVFINDLGQWWPKEYTWSQEEIVTLKVEPKLNGLFSEIGPYGFRCDWGRILEISKSKLVFLWQISPSRAPEPNPDKASTVELNFIEAEKGTTVVLTHKDFEKYGKDAQMYFEAMQGSAGWDYILSAFVKYL